MTRIDFFVDYFFDDIGQNRDGELLKYQLNEKSSSVDQTLVVSC